MICQKWFTSKPVENCVFFFVNVAHHFYAFFFTKFTKAAPVPHSMAAFRMRGDATTVTRLVTTPPNCIYVACALLPRFINKTTSRENAHNLITKQHPDLAQLNTVPHTITNFVALASLAGKKSRNFCYSLFFRPPKTWICVLRFLKYLNLS